MNNVVLARIFDSVTSEFTLGQISKILNMSVDEILDGLEKLVGKEIVPNLNYLMRNERTLSEEQFKRLDQIRIKSVYNKVYQHTAYDDDVETRNEEEKNELLLIQQLSDQIMKADSKETYIPVEKRKLSKEAEKMCGSYAEYFDPSGNDEDRQELTKWVWIGKKKKLCKQHDIEYRPDIAEEEICAGIYLYLLSQGYSNIRAIKFFPSAYEALNFYVTNNRGSKDVWAFQYDSDLFDENSDYYSLSV